jgi:hypothetical protein
VKSILSRVRGPVTNNNGFWIRWLDLLHFYYNYNQLQHLTINGCLRLAPFLTGLRVSSLLPWLTWFWFTRRSLLQLSLSAGYHSTVEHWTLLRMPNDGSLTNELTDDWLESISCPPFTTRGELNRDDHLEQFVYIIRFLSVAKKLTETFCSNALISISVSVAADTRFSEPLSRNGLFRLSGVMSQYEYYIYRLICTTVGVQFCWIMIR